MTDYKRILKNDYFKAAVAIALVVAILLALFFGLGLALDTSVPLRVVESGSMCTDADGCDGWNHPFDQTLHIGDIIILQGIAPQDINDNYPNSDIIVYQNPEDLFSTPIVHRVVAKYEVNGTWYFQTKGDGNGADWPVSVSASEYDSRIIWRTGEGVPQNLVLGRVVMRIPYFGWITLVMKDNNWIVGLVIVVVAALILIEFVLPLIRVYRKKRSEQQNGISKAV